MAESRRFYVNAPNNISYLSSGGVQYALKNMIQILCILLHVDTGHVFKNMRKERTTTEAEIILWYDFTK